MLVIFPWWGIALGIYFCLFSVIPSAPPLLFPLLPAYQCIIQEDKANDDESIKDGNDKDNNHQADRATMDTTTTTPNAWRCLDNDGSSAAATASLSLPAPLPTWGTLFTLLIHLIPGRSFVDDALTMTRMTITTTRIKLTRMTSIYRHQPRCRNHHRNCFHHHHQPRRRHRHHGRQGHHHCPCPHQRHNNSFLAGCRVTLLSALWCVVAVCIVAHRLGGGVAVCIVVHHLRCCPLSVSH
jgi:hypothetical protein